MNKQSVRILTVLTAIALCSGAYFSFAPKVFSVSNHDDNQNQNHDNNQNDNHDNHNQNDNNDNNNQNDNNDPCKDNREDCVTPSPSPSPEATPTPTPAPQGNGFGLPGDGLSDGRSDGRSSCPECTSPPAGGQVLGATTEFAGTGVAEDAIMNVVGALGGLSTASGLVLTAKKKFNR